MKFIDSHIHLQDFTANNTTEIIKNAEVAGVGKFISIFSQKNDWQQSEELISKFGEKVIPAFGYHPWYGTKGEKNWLEKLEQQLLKYPRAMLGECGLDRIKIPDYEPQAEMFRRQIELAKKLKRVLLIHAVKADEWLEDFWDILPQKFIFHSFNGRAELMRKTIKHGGYISFSFSILGNKDKDRILKEIPLDCMLLETDSPFQSMIPGKENQPARLPFLAEEIARIRNQDLQEMTAQILQNTERLIANE